MAKWEPVRRLWREFNDDNVALIAAGIAFHVLLAIFPALGAFVALYGLVADVSQVPNHLHILAVVLPPDLVVFLGDQMTRLAQARSGGLSLALVLGLSISIWSANGAMRALFLGLNIAYGQSEKRSFVRVTLLSLAFTFGLFVLLILCAATLAAGAVVEGFFGSEARRLADILRWPVLLLAFGASLSLLYRYGASRPTPHWRSISWGSAAATLAWVAMSGGFSLYLAQFAHYERTYGSLGAVVGLMVWAWFSAMIVLAGAELEAELSHGGKA